MGSETAEGNRPLAGAVDVAPGLLVIERRVGRASGELTADVAGHEGSRDRDLLQLHVGEGRCPIDGKCLRAVAVGLRLTGVRPDALGVPADGDVVLEERRRQPTGASAAGADDDDAFCLAVDLVRIAAGAVEANGMLLPRG